MSINTEKGSPQKRSITHPNLKKMVTLEVSSLPDARAELASPQVVSVYLESCTQRLQSSLHHTQLLARFAPGWSSTIERGLLSKTPSP